MADPMAASSVRPARREDEALLGQVLADAFTEDPVFTWLIPAGARNRDQRMLTFFTSMSRSYLRAGKPCYLVDDAAAALWSEPGHWEVLAGQLIGEAAPAMRSFRLRLFRALRTQLEIERLHPKLPLHWYLGYLGAIRDRQGQGLGGQLLRAVLDGADEAGVPAYLESSNERNLTLYKRHGFQVVGELRALGRGPMIWRMWRDAAS